MEGQEGRHTLSTVTVSGYEGVNTASEGVTEELLHSTDDIVNS